MTVSRALRGVRWYLREATGEADYDRYVSRERLRHGDAAVLSRRDFERRKATAREANPGARCC